MAQVVQAGFKESEWAVIVTGENFPDALAASSLAGARGCPVVLCPSDELTDEVKGVLENLRVSSAYVVGGESSVGPEVADGLAAQEIEVTRVFGQDRYATSVEAAKEAREVDSASDTLIICTGEAFADSLSISPYSWRTVSPILLARDGVLTDDEVAFVEGAEGIKRILIIGGDAAVSEEVASQLGDGFEYVRLEGQDCYDTSAAVAEWACEETFSWSTPGLATGENFPDALAGSALMGSSEAPLLLVSEDSDVAKKTIGEHRDEVTHLMVLGGEASVSEELVKSISEG
jgi:putative cell wall-binding protein